MQLIILASGRGFRLGKYTRNKPKCLVNVCNNTIVSYIMPIFKFYKEVILISGYKSEILQNYLKLRLEQLIVFVKTKNVQ